MTKKSIFLTFLFLISIFYFLISIFPLFSFHLSVKAVETCGSSCYDTGPVPPPPPQEANPNPPPSCTGKECDELWEPRGGGGEDSQPGAVYYCYLPDPPRGAAAAYQCAGTRRFNPADWRKGITESENSICFLGALTCSPEGDPCQKSFISPSGPGYCSGESRETIEVIRDCEACPSFPHQPCWGCEKVLDYQDYDDMGRVQNFYKCIVYTNKCCSEGSNEGSCYAAGGDCVWSCHGYTFITPTPAFTPTPTPIPAPNCKNLKINNLPLPATVLKGDTITLSADYENGAGTLTSAGVAIVKNQNVADNSCKTANIDGLIFSQNQTGGPNTYSFNWPTGDVDEGSYVVFCRGWNDGYAECRGRCVDGPPRYQCKGTDNQGATSYGTIIIQNPAPWYKLKDTSLNKLGSHIIAPPQNIKKFTDDDADDTTQRVTILGENGVLLAQNNDNPGPSYNKLPVGKNNWSKGEYGSFSTKYLNIFYDYARSRKNLREITSLNEIASDGLYLIKANNLTLNTHPAHNFVLIVRNQDNTGYGDINVDINDFNNNKKSIALIAKNISFSSSTQKANGIFIATGQMTYQSSEGLKISGNLISNSVVSLEERADNSRPSLFIVLQPKMYLDLLPYLSISKYEQNIK